MSANAPHTEPSASHWIEVLDGPTHGAAWPIPVGRLIVGRSPDCAAQIDHPHVSRHHCVFLRDEFAVRVRDLGSRNGTTINRQRTQGESVILPGDIVAIGQVLLRYVTEEPSAASRFRIQNSSGPAAAWSEGETVFNAQPDLQNRSVQLLT